MTQDKLPDINTMVRVNDGEEIHRIYDPGCPCGVKPYRDDHVLGWEHQGQTQIRIPLFGEWPEVADR